MNQFTYSHSRTCDCIRNSCNDFLFYSFRLYNYVLYFLSLLIFSLFSYIPLLSIFNILYILPLSFLSCSVLFIFLYLFCYILLYLYLFLICSIYIFIFILNILYILPLSSPALLYNSPAFHCQQLLSAFTFVYLYFDVKSCKLED